MRKTWSCVLLIFIWIGSQAQARWTSVDEAEAILEEETTHISIEKDGQALSQSDLKIKILNEKGRIHFGTLRYSYSPQNYHLKVENAVTLSAAQQFKVNDNDIVDTPIQATEGGFDELRQVVVSFPHVEIGNTLSFRIINQIHKPSLKDQYSERFVFGQAYPQKHLALTVQSKIPLFIQINDPEQAMEMNKTEKDGNFTYSFQLKKPVFHEVTDEVRSFLPANSYTWVVISSNPTYEKMYTSLAGTYEKILEKPLPPSLQSIVDNAKLIKEPIAQMNAVLSAIADAIRYMGDWRSVDGGFVPRSLELIASTHYGDCKDMSLLTTKVLRLLGFDAHISLVQRGSWPDRVPEVPYNSFNHAIVAVRLSSVPQNAATAGGDKYLWLDPTNFQSYAQGVMDDISDRKALIIKTPQPELQDIHFTEAKDTTDETFYQYSFNNENHRLDQVSMLQTGYFAAQHAGLGIDYSNQQIQDEILDGNVDKGDIYHYQFTPFDLKSRIVSLIKISWEVDHRYQHATTSTGPGLTIRTPTVISDLNRVEIESRKSDYSLGIPSITMGHGSINNFEVVGNKIRNCDIKSPWVDYSRKVFTKTHPVKMEDRMAIKTRWIHAEEMQQTEFKHLLSAVRQCSSDQLLIYRVPKIIDTQ